MRLGCDELCLMEDGRDAYSLIWWNLLLQVRSVGSNVMITLGVLNAIRNAKTSPWPRSRTSLPVVMIVVQEALVFSDESAHRTTICFRKFPSGLSTVERSDGLGI